MYYVLCKAIINIDLLLIKQIIIIQLMSYLAQEFYENDTIESQVYYIDGLMEGKYIRFYMGKENKIGNRMIVCNYIKGLKEGFEKTYYENGHLHEICYYKKNKLNGLLKKYYYSENLDLVLEKVEIYIDGDLHGECKKYDTNGLLEEVVNYEYGSLSGPCYKYKNGLLEEVCEYYKYEYLGEALVGEYCKYNNGILIEICNYDHNRKDGEYKEFHNNGVL
jgi:antitoxin component YwqK of YwqJK toxin-antitoxin module